MKQLSATLIQRKSNARWSTLLGEKVRSNIIRGLRAVHAGPAPANAGLNARPRHGAPLNSDFMTSSCSVKCVTIMVERRYTVQH